MPPSLPISLSPASGSRRPQAADLRLRKHADYGAVYARSRKQFARQMTYFFAPREQAPGTPAPPSRVGLTVGRVMGKAVDRNRIKRRMREAIRAHHGLLLTPVDVVLHPRRSVLELEFAQLLREVAGVFRAIQKSAAAGDFPPPSAPRASRR